MIRITTSRNRQFDADALFAPTFDGACMIQLRDSRRLIEVAQDFDGLEWLEIQPPEGPAIRHTGYTGLNMMQRTQDGSVQLKLIKEV